MNAQGAQWDYKCIPVNVQGDQRGISLEMDQESSGIELVYVCVWEGGEGRLGCGFILLYSIFYVLYSKFYILYILMFDLLYSKVRVYVLYFIFYFLYSIFMCEVDTLSNILNLNTARFREDDQTRNARRNLKCRSKS